MGKKQAGAVKLTGIGNMLTIARLVFLPVIVAGISLDLGWLTVGAMAAALVTDLLDGRLARRFNQASEFGRTLDSTIDFVLIYSLFIAFFAAGRLATHQFVVIYVAMLTNLVMQISAVAANASNGIVRTRTGKLTGALQYTYLLFLVVREVMPEGNAIVAGVDAGLFGVLTVAVVFSSAQSISRLRRVM